MDITKILVGEPGWGFLLEAAIRAICVYAMLLVVMRLIGKRMAGQMSRTEIAVIVTLGAAVGAPCRRRTAGC